MEEIFGSANLHLQKELIMDSLPTDFCHASTLVALPDGALLCCWFGGTHEGRSDVAIYSARKEAGAAKWSEPRMLADGAEANWNPVLYYGEDSDLVHLFYKEGQQIASWRTFVMDSRDGGCSWSAARELVPHDTSGGRGPVRNKLLHLADGRLLAGASTEHGLWTAFADISADDGVTWTKSAPVTIAHLEYSAGEKTAESSIAVSEQSFYGRGVIQPSLWEDDKGVHMLLRSSEGYIYRSDSADGGSTWCAAYPLALPNNNSGLDLVRVPAGVLYLVCNPVAANWGQRSPLSLFASQDGGATWQKICDLENEPEEFSYPAIIYSAGALYISYTWKRQNIACVRISLP